MDRVANYDADDLKPAREAGQGAEVVALTSLALEGEHRLGRESEFVADSDANAAIADVEGEIAGMGGKFQVLAPIVQLKASGLLKKRPVLAVMPITIEVIESLCGWKAS